MADTGRPSPHPYLDWNGPIAFAHRGGASDAPENTEPAFRAAVELGYRYLETDVHVTADGVLVAFHDDDLQRTCGMPGRISELPWSKVATARVDGTAPIPRLDELLDAWPDARWNIDCKVAGAVAPLARAVSEHQALDRVCVASFSDRRIRACGAPSARPPAPASPSGSSACCGRSDCASGTGSPPRCRRDVVGSRW